MSDPFKVGDVVVCVDDAMTPESLESVRLLRRGSFYRVVKIRPTESGRVRLGFQELPDPANEGKHFVYMARRFRHLPKATETFTAQIRACRPVRKGVDA